MALYLHMLRMLLTSRMAFAMRIHRRAKVPTQEKGLCPPDASAWVVFEEVSTMAIGLTAQHSEILFCFLDKDERAKLELPNTPLPNHLVPRDKWNANEKICHGATYSPNGIEVYDKTLGEARTYGAPTQCRTIQKWFKGCIKEWQLPSTGAISLPLDDNDGWWLLGMKHGLLTNQKRWREGAYKAMGIISKTNNCNTMTATVLGCALGLDSNLNLRSPGISNKGFTLNGAPDDPVDEPETEVYIFQRRMHFHACGQSLGSLVSQSVSASSGGGALLNSSNCAYDQVDWDHEDGQQSLSVPDVPGHFYAASFWEVGCYCDEEMQDCQCEEKCHVRDDCGVKVEDDKCQ